MAESKDKIEEVPSLAEPPYEETMAATMMDLDLKNLDHGTDSLGRTFQENLTTQNDSEISIEEMLEQKRSFFSRLKNLFGKNSTK